ncbi:SprT family zinc-dependent metalloprotease [Aminipila butyrica]|uniref:SprT family zinc-dependent metalloprotease n=1 Tax=Aminipila butyrica TaxID=433296 RepID=A0A858BT09_9FIRM|nr:SprT-like domain-containing protein [Aminipila butyrica]QIB67914.1 SprT family zinc-dependent metalloprotease [Aminipila butyrica]
MEYIDNLYKSVLQEARALEIPVSNKIKDKITINRRAKSRFGCCKKITKGRQESFEIELSYRLLDCGEKAIKQTLAHEVLHTCPNCDNHGALWKKYAACMNKNYGYHIKRTDTAENLGIQEDPQLKRPPLKETYILLCKNCGSRISRSRMSSVVKHPSRYRCRCGGKLERVQ